MSPDRLTIEAWRGKCLESSHEVDAIAVNENGETILKVGHYDRQVTWRSAAKPFQLQVALGALPTETVAKLTDREVSLGAASHTAEPNHLKALEALATKLNVDLDDLQCGPHPPISVSAQQDYLRQGENFTHRHNNCSGKHVFMLAASNAHYGDSANYLDPGHPLQRAILQLLGDFGEVHYAIDGCGAPCFISDLSTLARSWLSLGDLTNPIISRIKTAMCAQPWYYSGTDRLDYTLAGEGRGLLTKVGAAGLLGGILLDKGIAFALKIRDGSDLARPLATLEVLERLGYRRSSNETLLRRNAVGNPVGHWESHWDRK